MTAELKEPQRLNHLDSIRGIAAFTVMLCHCWNLSPEAFREAHASYTTAFASAGDVFYYVIGTLLTTGRTAVMLFFVLSGFVLAYSLQNKPMPYSGYLIKRLFRIYPVFLWAILFSCILHHLGGGIIQNASKPEVRSVGSFPLSLPLLLKHLLLFGNNQNCELDPPMWSIVHEIRISIIFPIVFLSVVQFRWRGVAWWFLISVLSTWWTYHRTHLVVDGNADSTVIGSFISSIYFIVFFACGVFLSLEREGVARVVANFSSPVKLLLIILCAYALLQENFGPQEPISVLVDYLHGTGSLILLAFALGNSRFIRMLNHRALIWLGRISYSLYLFHFLVIYMLNVVNEKMGEPLSPIALSLYICAVSLFLSDLISRTIEFPCIRVGKMVASSLRGASRDPQSLETRK